MNENIGYCEGLCGGLLSHHLVDGLCPDCRNNPAVQSPGEYEHAALGAEADVSHALPNIREVKA